jgi:7,8-dihydropterin-6-yl-methyl-4-(beta-D-ribofuranosyl)aminobenzene 5'-phosphate synthase
MDIPLYDYPFFTSYNLLVVLDLHPDRPDERGACLTKPSPPGSAAPLEPIEYVAWGKEASFPALESAGGQVKDPFF